MNFIRLNYVLCHPRLRKIIIQNFTEFARELTLSEEYHDCIHDMKENGSISERNKPISVLMQYVNDARVLMRFFLTRTQLVDFDLLCTIALSVPTTKHAVI